MASARQRRAAVSVGAVPVRTERRTKSSYLPSLTCIANRTTGGRVYPGCRHSARAAILRDQVHAGSFPDEDQVPSPLQRLTGAKGPRRVDHLPDALIVFVAHHDEAGIAMSGSARAPLRTALRRASEPPHRDPEFPRLVGEVVGDAGAGEDDDADRQRRQELIVALEGRRLAMSALVGTEERLVTLRASAQREAINSALLVAPPSMSCGGSCASRCAAASRFRYAPRTGRRRSRGRPRKRSGARSWSRNRLSNAGGTTERQCRWSRN